MIKLKTKNKEAPIHALNGRFEIILKEFLSGITEASYQIALELGFKGSFLIFLAELEKSLQQVIEKKRGSHLKIKHVSRLKKNKK